MFKSRPKCSQACLCCHADLAKIFFGLILVTVADEELALPSPPPSLSSPMDPCQKLAHTALSWCPVSQEMMVRIHLPAQVHPLQELRGFINYTAFGWKGIKWRVWTPLLGWLQGVHPDLTSFLLCSSQISSSSVVIPASFMLPSSLKVAFVSVLFVPLRTDLSFLVRTSGQLWL